MWKPVTANKFEAAKNTLSKFEATKNTLSSWSSFIAERKVFSGQPSLPIKGTLEGVHIQDHPDHLKNQHNRLPGTSLPVFASCSSSSGSGSLWKFLYQHHHQCHQQKITIAMLSSVVLDPDINQSCWCFVMKNYKSHNQLYFLF